ncbi:hypothetical protein BGI41_05070 [Methanobrevibacter sp. 87.7]|uniref:hypothetical protein n=1 Tax=Methanobrevibacter sp. 87.7 TaxID=387957 RepID=UPI000B50223E|nr:hypothetical protein [Methanobrevibacter sp. 87.7]OWT32933.1 hypothetical protein BGI41_05070 [Methanobrevibacter sp. 87.7]
MDRKYQIIIAIIVIIIIAIGASYALGFLDFGPSTQFDNKFMKGTFQGEVVEQPISNNSGSLKDWSKSYKDKTNGIEYNMSSLDNVSLIVDIMSIQAGLKQPETREYNDVNWTIYYSQAVPNTNASINNTPNNTSQNVYDVYICEAFKNNQSYLIYVVSNGTVKCDGSTYCDLYTKNIEPLLKSIELKQGTNVPKINDTLGVSRGDYNKLVKYVEAYKAGNITSNGNNQAQ